MSVNKLPQEIQSILPEIIEAIPIILSGNWLGALMVPGISLSPEFQMIKNNPEWKAIALQEIENEFGKATKARLIVIFGL